MRNRTILTAFGPYLQVKENPSTQVADALDRTHYVLDVSYEAVEQFLDDVDPESFDRLLMIGVAPGRDHLCAELFARNTYGNLPDNSGLTRTGPIMQGAPLLVNSTLFGAEALSEVLVSDPLVRMSLDAGAYLCNFGYYRALAAFPDKQVGLLHIPTLEKVSLREQLGPVNELLDAVEAQPVAASMPEPLLRRHAS